MAHPAPDKPIPVHAVQRWAEKELKGAPPKEIIRWVWETFGERAGLSCSFGGAGGIALAHMVAETSPGMPILFIDTDFLFPQTYELKSRLEREWGLNIKTFKATLSPEEQTMTYGPNLWAHNPDLCCFLRKVEPMAHALFDLDCWVTALRRDQSKTRANLQVYEVHSLNDGRSILKVNPIAHWHKQDVWSYIFQHRLPYNPLLDQGYMSLGCMSCTSKVNGTDEREGRWKGQNKTECGLHTFTRRDEKRDDGRPKSDS